MKREKLLIRMSARPVGLKFKTPESAIAKWDRTIKLKKDDADDGVVEISIMGEIGPSDPFWGIDGVTANFVQDRLRAAAGAPVRVVLNSPGGDAFEGIAIYNLLREHAGEVTTHVIGLAASAASIVAMAGDRIEMAEGAMMMIHSAWGLVMGNQNDMRQFADMLNKIDASVADVYARRSGQKTDAVMAMMEKETWMTAFEAVDEGFADVAVTSDKKKKVKNRTGKPVFAHVPSDLLAALGDRQKPAVRLSSTVPGATGSQNSNQGRTMKPIAEQIASFEAKRAASVARMEVIMSKASDEGRSLDDAESQEYDGLESEVSTVDTHLVRLKKHEAIVVAKATAVRAVVGTDPAAASAARGGEERHPNSGIISVRSRVEKAIPFTRYVKALAMAKGSPMGALMIAQANRQWKDETPEVEKVLMAAVAAGDTTTAGWAAELVYNQNLVADFIEFLRPMTIIGRIPGLTPVPFNVRVAGANSGSSAYWVGQGKPMPVSKMGTFAITLGQAKAAGLVVLDQELIRSSAPSAEILVRNDLGKAVGQFTDTQFVSPDVAAVANVSPASITNGVVPTLATGTDSAKLRADVQTLFNAWISQNLDPSGGVWIMTPTQALAISLMLNALGQPVFSGPGNTIDMNGGRFFGLPVVTSQSAIQIGSPVAGEGQMIILLNAPEIMLADDGAVTIDASGEASLEMLDNPTNQSTASPVATSQVSMFQTNSVALRATRFINWAKRRAIAAQYIKDAAYIS